VHDLAVERIPDVVPQPWRAIYRRGLRVAARRAAVLCADSEATRAELMDEYSIAADRIVVTSMGPNVTPETERDANIAARLGLRLPFILAVGTVEPRKNHLGLVRAFTEADMGGITLVIAGAAGWGQAAVDEYLDSQDLRGRVFLTGKVTDAEMAWLYSETTAFAMPSLYEGFGIPLLEAMSFGIPSVASTTPALAELAGDAALLVEATDVPALAGALVDLVHDEALRLRLSSAGPERARPFTWERTAALTIEAYEKAAAG
jgi:glycosyltransferase involved in cell wall biosynthesis